MRTEITQRGRRWAIATAVAAGLAVAGGAAAQELPKTSLKVVGAWGNLLQYKEFEKPFWTEELAKKSNTMILPANVADTASMVATAMRVFQQAGAPPADPRRT